MEPKGSLLCSREPTAGPYSNHANLVHTFPPYFSKIHSNIIFPSMPMSSEWSLPFSGFFKYRTNSENTSCCCYIFLDFERLYLVGLTNSMEQPSWEAHNHPVKKFPIFYGIRRFITFVGIKKCSVYSSVLVTVAVQSKAYMSWTAQTLGSGIWIPLLVQIYVSIFLLSCLGTGLVLGQSPFQGFISKCLHISIASEVNSE
jgi:hypothetical protein